MNDILERLKDPKTSIPGALASVWAVIDILNEYGLTINISQRTAVNVAIIVVGVGLLLSGGRKKDTQDG